METIAGIFLSEEKGSECAAHPLDALYAWDQQDIAVHVPDSDHCNYNQAFYYEKIADDKNNLLQVTNLPAGRLQVTGKTGNVTLELETWNCVLQSGNLNFSANILQ